jgi:hypothetical protein
MSDWAGGPVVRCRTPAAAEVGRLFRERYAGFTVKHFHEHLRRSHGPAWGYTWTKAFLQSRGLVTRAPRRGAHVASVRAGRWWA